MAIEMFLKLDNIQGEATASPHKGEIDVLAWSWGLTNSGTTHLTGGAGKATAQDISLAKWVDRASPLLFVAMVKGTSVGNARLTLRKSAGANGFLEFLVISMKTVFVTSQSDGGSGGEDRLTENITLNFAEVDIKYVMQKPDGTVGQTFEVDWNIARNTVR